MEKERNFILINVESKIQAVLQQHLSKGELFIKQELNPKVTIVKLADNNSLVVKSSVDLSQNKEVIFFKVMARYIEVYCDFVQKISSGIYLLKVRQILIAHDSRKFKRFLVKEWYAYICNSKIPKVDLNSAAFASSTVVSVNFSHFEKELKSVADSVKIKRIHKEDEFEKAFAKAQKPLLVLNSLEENSYKPKDKKLFDYHYFLGDKLQTTINNNRARGIQSILCMPVCYTLSESENIVLGYIELLSYSKQFTEDILPEMEKKAFEILKKIIDANSNIIRENQSLIDISVQGMAVEITNPELQESLPKQRGFYFDLVVRNLQPVSLYAEIVSIEKKKNGTMLMGLQIPRYPNSTESLKKYHENLRYHVKELTEEKVSKE